MKSNLTSIRRPTHSVGFSRAQFSPVLRGITRDSALHGPTVSGARDTSLTPFWDPHVLDRLQSPLTRIRD
jgi:hypothetical protein